MQRSTCLRSQGFRCKLLTALPRHKRGGRGGGGYRESGFLQLFFLRADLLATFLYSGLADSNNASPPVRSKEFAQVGSGNESTAVIPCRLDLSLRVFRTARASYPVVFPSGQSGHSELTSPTPTQLATQAVSDSYTFQDARRASNGRSSRRIIPQIKRKRDARL